MKNRKNHIKHQQTAAKSSSNGGGGMTSGKPKLAFTDKSLISTYKHATKKFLEWGRSAYDKHGKRLRRNNTRGKGESLSLASLFIECSNLLGATDVRMPPDVLKHLRTAIYYRKKVGSLYRLVPSVSEDDQLRHQWLIEQMENMELLFSATCEHDDNDDTENIKEEVTETITITKTITKTTNRFSTLSTMDDDDDDDDQSDNDIAETEVKKRFTDLSIMADDNESDGKSTATSDKDRKKRTPTVAPAMTHKEVLAEESIFAISLVMLEISEAREDLRKMWRDYWAIQTMNIYATADPADEDQAEKEGWKDFLGKLSDEMIVESTGKLVAATACTDYALIALRKLILQTSIEFNSFHDFDQILFGAVSSSLATTSPSSSPSQGIMEEPPKANLRETDCVLLRNLPNNPDLIGREGMIISKSETGKCAVRLFERRRPYDYDQRFAKNKQDVIVMIKQENLVYADTTFHRLQQTYKALKCFKFDSILPSPSRDYDYASPPESRCPELRNASFAMGVRLDEIARPLHNYDFAGMLNVILEDFLPIWISMAKYSPDLGGPDIVLLNSYLREFAETREIKFHLVLAIMVAIDAAFSSHLVEDMNSIKTTCLMIKVYQKLYDFDLYQEFISYWLQRGWNPNDFYSYYEYKCQAEITRSMGCLFPWISGEFILNSIHMYLACGTDISYQLLQEQTTILHLYWALRCEGHINPMPDIENTLIRMYSKFVFFRGGLPEKGKQSHFSCWQVSLGNSLNQVRVITGRQMSARSNRKKQTKSKLEKEGLHVTEISRLLDILQWKTMRLGDNKTTFEKIQNIAEEETRCVFFAPIFSTSLKLLQLSTNLHRQVGSTAKASLRRMIVEPLDFNNPSLYEFYNVCFWGLSLADGRLVNDKETTVALRILAKYFKDIFKEDDSAGNSLELYFSPNDHNEHSLFWGEKGK